MKFSKKDKEFDDVYGNLFSLHTSEEHRTYTKPLEERFRLNDIDPVATFKGKNCLDAGCGGGRGALFMLMSGANFVTCVDISPKNIETTTRHLTNAGYENFRCLNVPFSNAGLGKEAFDFVWNNGVIMHTENPDDFLSYLSTLLKPNGQAWIYVYGAGGFYWYFQRRIRQILNGVKAKKIIDAMNLCGETSVLHVAGCADNFTTPYLRVYSQEDFGKRLTELGFADVFVRPKGLAYDTSQRRICYPEDLPWVGDGDLRYLIRKAGNPIGHEHKLDSGEIGSTIDSEKTVSDKFAALFDRLEKAVAGNEFMAIMASARIEKYSRLALEADGPIDIDALHGDVLDVIRKVEGLHKS